MSLADDIDAIRFSPVRLTQGYDMDEVDRFLEEVRGAVSGPDAAARALELLPRVRSVRFTPVRVSEGYDMDDVDGFLDTVVLEGLEQTAAGGGGVPSCEYLVHVLSVPPFPRGRVGTVYAMADVDDLVSRATAALETADDEEERRRAALGVLEQARPRTLGGLAAGYRTGPVDERLSRVANLLRTS